MNSLIAILIISFSSFSQAVPATAITVTTTVDEYGTGADCSLREAITAANTDAPFGGCPAGNGHDIIHIPAGIYTLTIGGSGDNANIQGDLDVHSNITFMGEGTSTTIIQAGTQGFPNTPDGIDRVFDIHANASFVSFDGITIRHGHTAGTERGGGIHYSATGTLTITNSIIQSNTSMSGAGLRNVNNGSIIIDTVTFALNHATAGSGGAVSNEQTNGFIAMANSTLYSNLAPNGGTGGGISNWGTLHVKNSTFSDNYAGTYGSHLHNRGISVFHNVTVWHGTITSFGGNIHNHSTGTFTLNNSIIGSNVYGDFCSGTGSFQGENNLLDQPCDAIGNLGRPTHVDTTLRDNGGATRTHALLEGSNALDMGINDCRDTEGNRLRRDQRGVPRPQNSICDIGAFEWQDPMAITLSQNIIKTNYFGLLPVAYLIITMATIAIIWLRRSQV
jgi:CSLREA domain-containing protein